MSNFKLHYSELKFNSDLQTNEYVQLFRDFSHDSLISLKACVQAVEGALVETRIQTFYLFVRNTNVIKEAFSIHKEVIKINFLVRTNSISFGEGGDPGTGGQAIKRSIFFENVIIVFHNAQTSRKAIQLITVLSDESCLYNTNVHSRRY